MPKVPEKIKKLPKPVKIAGAVIGALLLAILLVVGAAAGYTGATDNSISFDFAGKSVDFVNKGGMRGSIKDQAVGCCTPHCTESDYQTCIQSGGQWHKGGCGLVPDCDEGCCLPYCQETTKIFCERDLGNLGSWVPGSCDKLEECKDGCCEVACLVRTLPKASCDYMEGHWTKGKCITGCCDSESVIASLPQFTCEKCADGTWHEEDCPKGFSFKKSGGYSGPVDWKDMLGGEVGTQMNWFMGIAAGGDVTVDYQIAVDLYTCEETPLSEWQGTMTTDFTRTIPKEGTESKTETKEMVLNLESGETGMEMTLMAAAIEYSAKVTQDQQMSLTMDTLLVPPIVIEGKISKGAPQCEQ